MNTDYITPFDSAHARTMRTPKFYSTSMAFILAWHCESVVRVVFSRGIARVREGGVNMNLQILKIGGVVMVMALVTYVFFPANAELAKQGKASTQINATPSNKTPQSARTESGKLKNVQKKSALHISTI